MRDATDSFYEWIGGKTAPGSRPSPKQCYEAGYNNALAGIPNPEAVRELVEAARHWRDTCWSGGSVAGMSLAAAIKNLDTAPSTGAQQK